MAVFRSRFKNIVDFDAGPPPALVNRSAVISQGGELSFSLRPNKSVTLSAHTSYVKTDITNSTDKLRDRPKWRGGTRVMWTPRNDFLLSASWLSVGEVFDSSIPTGDVNLASYNKLDMTATWSMNSMAKFSLSVDNLLNEDYEETGRLFRGGKIDPRGGRHSVLKVEGSTTSVHYRNASFPAASESAVAREYVDQLLSRCGRDSAARGFREL